MSQLAREELAEILFQEIGSYLPNIQRGITDLYLDGSNEDVLYEVHRLFHNIKGAASQVAFLSLSKTAAVCEAVSGALLEQKKSPVDYLDFLASTTVEIEVFCSHDNKITDVEDSLFGRTAHVFTELVGSKSSTIEVIIPESLQTAISQSVDRAKELGLAAAIDKDELQQQMRQECLVSLRSVIPLLQEFTGYLSDTGAATIPQRILHPLGGAIATLAECSLAAGLHGQYRLLSDFQIVIDQLLNEPSLFRPEIGQLLTDFIAYLDIVFSLEPDQGEEAIARIQDTVSGLVGSLIQGGSQPLPLDVLAEVDFQGDYVPGIFGEGDDFDESEQLDLLDEKDLFETEPLSSFGSNQQMVEPFEQLQTVEEPVPPSSEEDELLEIFQAECEEHMQAISHELNSLESNVRGEMDLSDELRENVSSMRRAVHTLKGAAAMTGFDVLAACAHGLEDLLDWLNDHAATITGEDVVIVAQAVDIIETLGSGGVAAAKADAQRVIDSISEYLSGRSGQALTDTESSVLAESNDHTLPIKDSEKMITESETPPSPTPIPQDTAEIDNDESSAAGNVRVRLGDLDELAAIEGELIVARGTIEKQLEKFSLSISNFGNVKESLQRKSQELEVGFEAQSLYGFGPLRRPADIAQENAIAPVNPEFDPIELDQYSQLNLIIRSLNEISGDMNALYAEMVNLSTGMKGQIAKQQLAMGVMQEKLLRIRMSPFSSITRMLFRTVRQTAAKLNKDVRLTITGEDVYMDRFIWSRTLDPLMHILRNCVDHGIEPAAIRVAAGKQETGQITIDALQRSRNVILRISDDGRGVDIIALKGKLQREGLISETDSYADEELLPFLFKPSISTKDDISTISGRGVGLDVVIKNIKELRGSVQILNRPGQGVTFELSIPITLSVNRAIIVDVAGSMYAIPLQDVVEVRKYPVAEIAESPFPSVQWRDKTVRVYDLAPLLGSTATYDAHNLMRLMLVVDTGNEHVALGADRVVEQREIVIKDLGSHLRYVRGISGVTLTGEGQVIPILNLVELAQQDAAGITAVVSNEVVENKEKKTTRRVLVIDDSISVRHAISRLLESQSWKPTQAVDGIDGLEKLQTFTPDIIIVDIEMPRMNGYEFMAMLRGDENRKSIPVIMLTSRASEKHRKKALELGVQHYVTKPYQDEAFIELLESIQVAQ